MGHATGVDPAAVREQTVAGIATGRFSIPDEVANADSAARLASPRLASPRTANVTGADYVIDGGLINTT